jgi:methanogenic corrinoid protein MtbC1
VDLGANLPPKSFGKAVAAADSLIAVAISVTTTGQEDELRRTIGAIRAVTDRPIVVGGRGTDAATAKTLGASAYAATATDAIAAIERSLAEGR